MTEKKEWLPTQFVPNSNLLPDAHKYIIKKGKKIHKKTGGHKSNQFIHKM